MAKFPNASAVMSSLVSWARSLPPDRADALVDRAAFKADAGDRAKLPGFNNLQWDMWERADQGNEHIDDVTGAEERMAGGSDGSEEMVRRYRGSDLDTSPPARFRALEREVADIGKSLEIYCSSLRHISNAVSELASVVSGKSSNPSAFPNTETRFARKGDEDDGTDSDEKRKREKEAADMGKAEALAAEGYAVVSETLSGMMNKLANSSRFGSRPPQFQLLKGEAMTSAQIVDRAADLGANATECVALASYLQRINAHRLGMIPQNMVAPNGETLATLERFIPAGMTRH